MPSKPKRKLAAIMFTDMVGYTALMQDDEPKARQQIERQREIISPLVKKHLGEVIQYVGDGTFTTFRSAIEAVSCAIEIQRNLHDNEEISLRIGIHIGDVVVEGDEVYGDGVNVASRLEPLAAPGGICISEKVNDEVKNQPRVRTKSLGRFNLKNVDHPIEVFALLGKNLSLPHVRNRFLRKPAMKRGLGLLAAVLTLVLIYIIFFRGFKPVYGDVASVGVLYLKNLGAPDDEYLSYGITEDVIIDLAKAGLIKVPPMNDILAFRESEMSLSEIAQKLRVRYILTGSLRREEKSFRLAVHLVEPSKGNTIWSERWEESPRDVSAIKGKMIEGIIEVLGLTPNTLVANAIQGKPTPNPDAYEFYLKGKYQYDHRENLLDLEVARGFLEKAMEIDSSFLSPKIKLGDSYRETGAYEKAMKIYEESLRNSIQSGDKLTEGTLLRRIGNIHLAKGDNNEALKKFNKSLGIFNELGNRAGEASILNNIGGSYYNWGKDDMALEYFEQALRILHALDNKRVEGDVLHNIGSIYYAKGDHYSALDYFGQSIEIRNEIGEKRGVGYTLNNIGLTYIRRGNYEEAQEYLEQSLTTAREIGDRRNIGFSLIGMGSVYNGKEMYDIAYETYLEALSISREIGDKYIESSALHSAGEISMQRADYKEASNYLKLAYQVWDEIENPSGKLWTLSWWALLELKQGDAKSAEAKVSETELLLEDTEPFSENTIIIFWNLSQVYKGLGQTVKAEEYLKKADMQLSKDVEKLRNKKDKDSFLSNVRENRMVAEAAKLLN